MARCPMGRTVAWRYRFHKHKQRGMKRGLYELLQAQMLKRHCSLRNVTEESPKQRNAYLTPPHENPYADAGTTALHTACGASHAPCVSRCGVWAAIA
ncbi:hypothetical protein KCP71_16045 [Salmonella enterica subsp. enterica]|nr:hypothetical protein KCP71_16045 [Salmonella enterica subsp. enterica]